MRGDDLQQTAMFSCMTLEGPIPANQPLRAVPRLTDRALERVAGTWTSYTLPRAVPLIEPERPGPCCLLVSVLSVVGKTAAEFFRQTSKPAPESQAGR